MPQSRRLRFAGRSHEDLRAFPKAMQQAAGYQLWLVQTGKQPDDWKPMKSVGSGVNEIRIRDQTGAFRVIYVAKFEEAVYVLHCFEKKSQKTSQADLDLAAARYRSILAGRLQSQ